MIYKDKLKNLRENKGISQKEIANFLNISPFTYSHYENEQDIIPSKYLNDLANYLNVSIDYIFSLTSVENYSYTLKDINKIKSGQRLKDLRKEKKLTQKRIAEILNTAHQVISKYEKGVNLIATPFLYTICKKYNISADYLLGKIDHPKYLE